jgi:hypothetical protein
MPDVNKNESKRSAMMISLDEGGGRVVVLCVLGLALAAWLFIPA